MQRVFTKREKVIFYITVAVLMFSVVFKLLDWAVLGKNDTLNREISLTRSKFKKYLRLLSQKESIQNKYNKVSFASDVSDRQGSPSLGILSELERFAKDANIRIADVRPQAEIEKSGDYKEITVDIKAEGEMEGFVKFIYLLENSLSLLRIKRFQLNGKPNTRTLEGTFTISQFSTSE